MKLPQFSLLLAEDNPVNQRVATLQLQKLGLTAFIVKDGKEALTEMTRKQYDVVLLDCQMPEMDGYEVAIRYRELNEATPAQKTKRLTLLH